MTAAKKDQRVRGNQDDQHNRSEQSHGSDNLNNLSRSVKGSASAGATQAKGKWSGINDKFKKEGHDLGKHHHPHRVVYPSNIEDENLMDNEDDDLEDEIDDQMNTYPY